EPEKRSIVARLERERALKVEHGGILRIERRVDRSQLFPALREVGLQLGDGGEKLERGRLVGVHRLKPAREEKGRGVARRLGPDLGDAVFERVRLDVAVGVLEAVEENVELASGRCARPQLRNASREDRRDTKQKRGNKHGTKHGANVTRRARPALV